MQLNNAILKSKIIYCKQFCLEDSTPNRNGKTEQKFNFIANHSEEKRIKHSEEKKRSFKI